MQNKTATFTSIMLGFVGWWSNGGAGGGFNALRFWQWFWGFA